MRRATCPKSPGSCVPSRELCTPQVAWEGLWFTYSCNQRWVSGLILGASDTESKTDSPLPFGVYSPVGRQTIHSWMNGF